MIQVNELRIGNLCRDRLTGTLLAVEKLTKLDVFYYVVDRSKYPLPVSWQAEPIPLTAELLEKCGCKLRDGYIKNYPLYSITSQNGKEQIQITGYISLPQIKYLHQLQNLYFALTGEELEINPSHISCVD
jgi:hypothetical protein